MNKKSRNGRKAQKRNKLLSVITAFLVLFSCLPMSELSDFIKKINELLITPISASAAKPAYPIGDFVTPGEKVNGEDCIKISSFDDLAKYSQAYYNFSLGESGYANHQEDIIFIAIGGGTGNNVDMEQYHTYEPIGTATTPFKGKIVFESGSPKTFNMSCPLFGEVYDCVQIENKDGTNAPITITRTSTTAGAPLIANKVRDDGEVDTTATWNVTFGVYDDDAVIRYGGAIGEIESNASINLTFTNNATSTVSSTDEVTGETVQTTYIASVEAKAVANNEDGYPVDAGALCGTLNGSLVAKYTGTNTGYYITSDNGNAGGLVGSMGSGASLTISNDSNDNLQNEDGIIQASNGYAGGIVGKNNGGTVTMNVTGYDVDQFIIGSKGAGGLFGYYKPPVGTTTLEVNKYEIDCKVALTATGTGYTGGLIGECESEQGTNVTIQGTATTNEGVTTYTSVTSEHASLSGEGVKSTAYGGLIGKYNAEKLADSLIIKSLTAVPTNSLASDAFGGAIAHVADDASSNAAYVEIDSFNLTSATGSAEKLFGGLVAKTTNGYIYAKNVVIGSSTISEFKGGSLVGDLGNGVLGMTGKVDLTNASPKVDDGNGQLVGIRGDALVYAENWSYTPNAVEIDNIGSWGDVLVIDGTKITSTNVFTISNHAITILTPSESTADNKTYKVINSVADFAKTSLLFQINTGNNKIITNNSANYPAATNISFTNTDTLNLSGTGLRGITRDDGTSAVEYSGTVDGNSHTVFLDIKNVGGSDRPVYRKQYLGLVAIANGASFENINFGGSILSKNGRTTSNATSAYVGTAAAKVNNSITCSNTNTLSTLSVSLTGSKGTLAGRLIGEATDEVGNISVSGSVFDGYITGNTNCTVGGVIGKIYSGASNAVWSFNDVTLKGNVTGVQKIGGLIAVLDGSSKATVKIGNTTAVKTDGIKVEGNNGSSMGGLFGYEWKNADVIIDDFKVNDTTSTITTVKQNGAGGTAGLAYSASGHWTVNKLDLRNIKMLTSNAGSVGMIVNIGKISSDGIYLELPSGYDYKLSFYTGSTFKSGGVFDEICAYSADNANSIMKNGQGIVSISTYDGTNSSSYKLKMASSSNADNSNTGITYQAQTSQGATANPNTRYYYNLDLIDTGDAGSRKYTDLSTASDRLMRWGVYCYAASNIQKYFKVDKNDLFSFSSSDSYDMRGYSWYPITLDSSVTVEGTFTFYNEEFTKTETADTSTTNKWSPLAKTQHYMMQNGLFYDVNANLTIGTIVLSGNIGAVDTKGTGALVYGTVKGKSSATNDITTINSMSGSISLAGIKVWNFQGTGGVSANYAPLLINRTGSFVSLKIGNVSTGLGYSAEEEAATSLIGYVGSSFTDSGVADSDTYITLDFSDIKLDGRSSKNSPELSGYNYNTTKSIFTRATLLERSVTEAGSYTFTYADDWGAATGGGYKHNVTYGKEVGYTTTSNGTTQYPSLEQYYSRGSADDDKYPTQYSSIPTKDADPSDSFSGFLPYVKVVSTATAITEETEDHYQLKVNHQPSAVIEGCGTYTDPYVIKSSAELVRISKWINGTELSTAVINARFDNTFCDGDDHLQYSYSGGNFVNGSSSKSPIQMRQYLAGAYYIIRPTSGTDIELTADSGFIGLGEKTDGFHFRGVIIGGVTNASITNKTQYSLINFSDGSVVKNLTINVGADITLDEATETYNYITEGKKFAYGSVISAVAGGDNIIDNVQVNFGSHTIKVTGKKAQFQAVGGYVGVVVNGGVIFKNMTGNISGLTNSNVITDDSSNTTNQSPTDKRTNLVSDPANPTVWLYVNPIIGRVINGFAVTESNAYRPFEDGTRTVNGTTTYWAKKESDGTIGAVDSKTYNTDDYSLEKVTMKNGTKHYSIADIKSAWLKDTSSNLILSENEKLEVSSSYAITAQNAQSFYIMSLIVNSGMGTEQNFTTDNANTGNKIGYYNAGRYQTVRRAEYNTVGTKASNADYLLSINDTYAFAAATKLKNIPYLIAKYTKPVTTDGTDYYAKNIANSNNTCSITLSGGTYYLPDGFQGIGGKIISKKEGSNGSTDITNDSSLRINNFIGAGSTISLNMNYNYYYSYKDATSLYVFDNTYIHIDNVGLGLFNIQNGTTNNVDSSRYYNFIITGNVKAECVDNKFTNGKNHIPYVGPMTNTTQKANDGIDRINMISVGSLIGTMKAQQTIDSVAIQDVDIKGIRYTGGMIGWNPETSKTITIKNTQSKESYGIKVHGAGNTGGMIGRSYQSEISIDNNNATYSIIEVESDCENRTGNDYNYGVGGFIGNCRGGGSSLVEIKNVTVGTLSQDSLTYVNSAAAEINAGGMIGIVNKCKLNLSDCTIYNQNVESQYTAAGLVGYFASAGDVSSISNVKIICKDGTTGRITSTNNFAGGFIGACKFDDKDITVSGSEICNYAISGSNYAGGIIGLVGHETTDQGGEFESKTVVNNVTIKDCSISASTTGGYSGGVIGYIHSFLHKNSSKLWKRNLYGYNILAKNLSITGATNQTGALCGGTNNTSYNIIKVVAFCQYNEPGKGTKTTEVVGGGNNYGYDANTTGAKGYVICADYNGVVSNTAWISSDVPIVTSGKSDITAASPYVNMNPLTEIDAASTPKKLLSDGASLSAVNQIQYDIENSVAGYYSNASAVENVLKSKISNFVDEMGSRTFNIGDRNFPVLIVDDISKINTTNRINNYIALLTNSNPSSDNTFNYAANTNNVYNVVMHKCVYDENGNTVTIKAGQTGNVTAASANNNNNTCLKRNSGQFYMNANDTDTIATNGQFSLLDIQYLNPIKNTQICYHLYVPIYVRKVLQYDFNILAESGTSYKITTPASDILGNVLVENIGTPVTLEFAYTYKRTAGEWIEAVNGGDTLLNNYPKKLLFDNSTSGGATLPSTTKMVLIDTQNNSKAYYLNDLYSGGNNAALNTTTGYLDLSKFSNGSSFSPKTFNEMMIVTVRQDDNGTLVDSSLHPGGTGIVTDNSGGTNDGITFRYSDSGEDGINASDRYTVDSITFRNSGSYLTEHYFLTIYTEYPETPDTTIYHYSISAGKTLGDTPYPSRISKGAEDNAANLFLGYVYDQEIRINSLDVGGNADKFCLSSTDNDYKLNAKLTARVYLTDSAKTGGLDTYIEDKRNKVKIFESILIQFNKHDTTNDIGVKGVEDVEVSSYIIGGQNVTTLNPDWNKQDNVIVNASYIELQNNVSLADKLTSNSDKSVLITANTTIAFEKTTGLSDQFYQEDQTGRTNVIAISKISSKESLTAYSKVSKDTIYLWDAKNNTASETVNQYYTNSTEKAYITHDALDMPANSALSELGGQLPQLGINANDPNDVKKLPSTIHTVGTYRVDECPIAWGNAQSIVCEVELRTIDSNYGEIVPIFSYLESSTFKMLDGITPSLTEYLDIYGNVQEDGNGNPITSPNALTYKIRKTYTKASLNNMLDSYVYKIPIEFKVYSGAAFENDTLTYANYGLYLYVYMLDSNEDRISVSTTPTSDYVKYTNARIYLEKVDPSKAS